MSETYDKKLLEDLPKIKGIDFVDCINELRSYIKHAKDEGFAFPETLNESLEKCDILTRCYIYPIMLCSPQGPYAYVGYAMTKELLSEALHVANHHLYDDMHIEPDEDSFYFDYAGSPEHYVFEETLCWEVKDLRKYINLPNDFKMIKIEDASGIQALKDFCHIIYPI